MRIPDDSRLPLYGTMFKEFEPGERFRYMSQGYDILAEIVENLTGVDDVADVAKSRVFDPLGMDDTNFAPHQGQAGMNTTAAPARRAAISWSTRAAPPARTCATRNSTASGAKSGPLAKTDRRRGG